MFKTIKLVGGLFLVSLIGNPLLAQTPDGETPAIEPVCDDLIGLTPGLYGLCVGFCEAQDCEATIDTATGEVTFDESCKPSSPKLLENYNKRRTSFDPPMPCVKTEQSGCPCWNQNAPEYELDQIGDGGSRHCAEIADGSLTGWRLAGCDASTPNCGRPNDIALFLAHSGVDGSYCYFTGQDGEPNRQLELQNQEEVSACEDSLVAYCESIQ